VTEVACQHLAIEIRQKCRQNAPNFTA